MNKALRTLLVLIGFMVLVAIYVFQKVSYFDLLSFGEVIESAHLEFVVNKTVRLILNDACCLMIIYMLFKRRENLRIAFVVFLFELLVLLPLYFIVKLSLEGSSEISSPFLSQIHRLIVNPMLMLLLILSFFYQRIKATKETMNG